MIDTLIEWTSRLLLIVGTFFYLAGTIGLLRFPDVYSRLHALAKADNLGLGYIVLGMAVQAESLAVAAKLLMIWPLTLAASASVGYAIARRAALERLAHAGRTVPLPFRAGRKPRRGRHMSGGLIFAVTGAVLFAMGGAAVILLADLLRRILAFNLMGSGVFLILTQSVALPLAIYGRAYFARAATESRFFWTLTGFLLAGLNALFLSTDLFNLYVTLEITGPLLLSAIACLLMVAGLLLKTALFPFHYWLPPAHGGAAGAWLLLNPPLITAAARVATGTFAESKISPLAWARFIAAHEYQTILPGGSVADD
ncbi:monovalent cation/H(+) antiporter subunit G [Propionivibrio limicola]|uniref:monovalent cation/H(+) antiporter subunit G n=1 Tax=Propionivibrio limicola TaxID=167645 RepID=UPI001292A8C0|nr:monovalent cation/H(+) antiporter subunit G [Propionivibrio limicola]